MSLLYWVFVKWGCYPLGTEYLCIATSVYLIVFYVFL